MVEKDELRQRLIRRIDAKRVKIDAFGRDLQRDGNRLNNLSIYCTAAAAIFTAGPALGGEKFAINVQQMLGLGSPTNVWQPLCLLAVILSAVATIANNLYKTREYATRLAKAQSCSGRLEGLQTSVEFGQLSLSEATKQYQQYISSVPFIPEEQPKRAPAG